VRRGETSFSAWVRRACVQRIEAEQGLGPEQAAQLRGLGVNLNQLAHAANEGRPVVLNPQMLAAIQGLLRENRTRIAAHYTEADDREAADAIRDFVADRYDQHPAPGSEPAPAPDKRKRSRDQGRER